MSVLFLFWIIIVLFAVNIWWPTVRAHLNLLCLFFIGEVSRPTNKPVKDRVRAQRVLRIVRPNKNHLLLIWSYVDSFVMEEWLWFALGRKCFKGCPLLSLNLFFCWSFLFLWSSTESLIKIRELICFISTFKFCLSTFPRFFKRFISGILFYFFGKLLFFSYESRLTNKPVKDCVWRSRILGIVGPNKLYLLKSQRYIWTLVMEEWLWFALGRKCFKSCLLLSLNLFFCWSFLFL